MSGKIRKDVPIKFFTSYSHKDEDIREELDVHLAVLRRHPAIEIWNDRAIQVGQEWDEKISNELNTADIILLLVSPRFLASKYIYDVEIKRAWERHKDPKDPVRLIPIIIKPCDWDEEQIADIQAIPRDGIPVTEFDDLDEILTKVVKEIRAVIPTVQEEKLSLNS
ncbi:MAG: toll/interleukin-1 receptor domain-containing protein [Bacteroidota bacterium]